MSQQELIASQNALTMVKLVAEYNRLLAELVAKGYERARLVRGWGNDQETSIENNQYVWNAELGYTLPRICIGRLTIEVALNYSYTGRLSGTFKHVKLDGGYSIGLRAVTLQTINRADRGQCSSKLEPAKIVAAIDRWLIKALEAEKATAEKRSREEEKAGLANEHYAAASKLREQYSESLAGKRLDFTSSAWGVSVAVNNVTPEMAKLIADAITAALKPAPRKCDCMRCLNGLDCSHGA